MKKGLRKLILSGTALAAVAATLGTSTYAWYTANETVSATDISGASAGAADASIFISRDHTKWAQTVSLSGTYDHDGDDATDEIPWVEGGNLLPVEYISGSTDTFKDLGTKTKAYKTKTVTAGTFTTDGSLFTKSGDVYTAVKSGEFNSETTYYEYDYENGTYTEGNTRELANGAAKHFTLYFRTSKIADGNPAPTVYLKGITLKNTTPTTGAGAYTGADNMFYTATNGYGVDTNQATYGVDFTQALKMVIRTNSATAGIASSDTSYIAENVNAKSWDLSAFQKTGLNDGLGTINAANNALSYYNHVMDTTLDASDDERQNQSVIAAKNTGSDARTAINLGTLKRDASYITVDFYIYLDGWDTYCYDACKGQNFDIELEFTSKAEEALTIAA